MTRTSVIVPCYNAAKTVGRAIDSVLAQTDSDLEIIAIDDGSSDSTATVLGEYDDRRIRVIRHSSNKGISAARNTGLAAAQGDFVAFLDSDDAWEHEFLQRSHEARNDADAVICGRTVVLPDSSTRIEHSALLGPMTGEQAALGMLTGSITPFPWDKVIRRSAFSALTYPTEVHRFEDQVVGVVALSRVPHVVSIPDPLIRYHIGSGSLTWGRTPAVTEAEQAISFLKAQLGDWLDHPGRRGAFDTCRTLFLMLTAQSAMRSDDEHAATEVLAACRARITGAMIASTVRRSPVFGVGAALLKLAPSLYRVLFGAYVRRHYRLT